MLLQQQPWLARACLGWQSGERHAAWCLPNGINSQSNSIDVTFVSLIKRSPKRNIPAARAGRFRERFWPFGGSEGPSETALGISASQISAERRQRGVACGYWLTTPKAKDVARQSVADRHWTL